MYTRRERLERKLELRREWAEKAEMRSSAEFEAAHKITEIIPFGQPILVGHHSESAHRNLLKRSAGHMDKACEEYDKARYHESKADNLEYKLKNTIFSDDPDAIEALEKKIADLEKSQEMMKGVNKICRTKGISDEEMEKRIKEAFPHLSDSDIHHIVCKPENLSYLGKGFQSYSLSNNNAEIRRCKQRIEAIKRRQERQEAAEESANGVIISNDSWGWCRITFAEKPEREILQALRESGFRWGRGSWSGQQDKVPECVKELAEA